MQHEGFLAKAARHVVVFISVGSLLAAFGAAVPGTQTAAAGPVKWHLSEAVIYENLCLFPVLARQGSDTSGFVTLDEALASGEVVVTERGGDALRRTRGNEPPAPVQQFGSGAQVNQLVLIHRGVKPLLLLAGEVVAGGKQDRVIARDRIVPPGAEPLPLNVFCVERGRWTGASTQFTAAKMMVHPSVREKAVVDQNQSEVWAAVRSGGGRNDGRAEPERVGGSVPGGVVGGVVGAVPGAPSGVVGGVPGGAIGGVIGGIVSREAPSESYVRIYGSERISAPVEAFANEMARRFARATAGLKEVQVVGVAVAYGGELAWVDIFASSTMFDRYWMKLLRSYAVEALARPRMQEKATIGDAREFLQPLTGRETIESEPGVYRWRQVVQGRDVEIGIETLGGVPLTLHLCRVRRTTW